MSETIKEKIQAPYKFTERETCELARKLAQANQRMAELEDQKKSVTSDFKARVDREQAEASLLAQHISQGYEMRETEANVTLFPKEGTKHYYNAKTGEFVREERMTQADYQIEMQFERKREAEKKAALPMEHDHRVEIKGPGNKVLLTVVVHTQPHGCGWRSRFAVVDGTNDFVEPYKPEHGTCLHEHEAIFDARQRAVGLLQADGTLFSLIKRVQDEFAKIEDAILSNCQPQASEAEPDSTPREWRIDLKKGRKKLGFVTVNILKEGDQFKALWNVEFGDTGAGGPLQEVQETEFDACYNARMTALHWLTDEGCPKEVVDQAGEQFRQIEDKLMGEPEPAAATA